MMLIFESKCDISNEMLNLLLFILCEMKWYLFIIDLMNIKSI